MVTANPQVRIANYSQRLVELYRERYWPEVTDNESLDGVTCADLIPLYEHGHENTIIYVQSMGDRVHFMRHFLPFSGALHRAQGEDRFILQSDFSGELGHFIDADLCLSWVKAACASSSRQPDELLKTWHTTRGARAPVQIASADARSASPSEDTIDREAEREIVRLQKENDELRTRVDQLSEAGQDAIQLREVYSALTAARDRQEEEIEARMRPKIRSLEQREEQQRRQIQKITKQLTESQSKRKAFYQQLAKIIPMYIRIIRYSGISFMKKYLQYD